VTCRKCKKLVSAQAQRLKKHLAKCGTKQVPKSRLSAQKSFLYAQKPDMDGITRRQPKVNEFAVELKSKDKKQIDAMLGKFIFSGNISFRAVDNQYFKEVVRLLNPAYRIQTRQTLGNEILNTVYTEVNNKMKNDLKERKGVLLQDGWSTSQNEPVISHCINVERGHCSLSIRRKNHK